MGFHVINPEMKADWMVSTPALDGGSHWVADKAYVAPPGTEHPGKLVMLNDWVEIGNVTEDIVFAAPKGGEVIQTIGQRFSGSLKFETLFVDDGLWDLLITDWERRGERISAMRTNYRAKTRRRNRRRKASSMNRRRK